MTEGSDVSVPPGAAGSAIFHDRPGSSCPNCGQIGHGRYCSACGERYLTAQDLSLRHFFIDSLPHELFDLNGRFLRTLKVLLLRPGMLASEFVAGRRHAYLPALRFYVIVFLFHATLTALLSGHHARTLLELVRQNDPWQLLSRLAASRTDVSWNDPGLLDSLGERERWLSEIGTMLLFLAVAGVQQVVFMRLGRRYLEHVTLALNVVTFYIVVITAIDAALGLFARSHFSAYDTQAQQWVGLTLLPIYWFLAIRRFYRLRVPMALAGTALLWMSNVLIAWCLNVLLLALLIVSV